LARIGQRHRDKPDAGIAGQFWNADHRAAHGRAA
jgi:hypothetical protein